LSTHVGPGIRRYVHSLATEAPAETLANALEMIRDRPDARSLLPQMTIPTLVVGATDDPIMPVHESIALAKELPNCQTVILQDCGHLSNIEQPKAFNDAIIAWMQQ
jgi:3-oxoadipate enol-lactonase